MAGLFLLLLSHHNSNFAIWYATYIFPIFPRTVGWFFGLFPFSVFEILLILIILYLLWGCIFTIINLRSMQGRVKLITCVKIISLRFFYFLSILFLIFVLTAGINYNRESYADHIGITVQDSSTNELIQLYLLLIERAEFLAEQIEIDDNGHFVLDRIGLYDHARQSMRNLNSLHGGLGTYFPRAKAPLLSRLALSNLNISGFFSPWTMEANYNGDMPGQRIPFTINHELAHVVGQMREDEANFVAYLASRNSEHVDFKYSAVYVALSYTLNALRRNLTPEQYSKLLSLLPAQLLRDFIFATAYWQAFQGPVAELQSRINDAYLRLNQQEDGVQSYGRMVDLLLAYYRAQNKISVSSNFVERENIQSIEEGGNYDHI
ncbi:MAG: DUF3810 domain-containing protein [Spirochaetaceae bacterium]|nr:DUF3810 domain-containing protein [Spirochaetaceae bacterium]